MWSCGTPPRYVHAGAHPILSLRHPTGRLGTYSLIAILARSSANEPCRYEPVIVRCKSKLLQPSEPSKGTWTFLVLPKDASARLPTRGVTSVQGIINGHPFRATLEPDGRKSHWLKVDKRLREAAGVQVGDVVALGIQSVEEQPEPRVPADLRTALAAVPAARAVWSDITRIARRDWIHWITSAKQSQTRARRIRSACEMLAAGKRRVCCFDRSGFHSKGFGAPKAAD